MLKPIGVILALLFWSIPSFGQIAPADFSVLNYRIAGFEVPENTNAALYVFQVAKGKIDNEQLFIKAISIKHKANKNQGVIELPDWGKGYTWRAVYVDKSGKEIGNSGLHHFQTGTLPYADTSRNGLMIIKPAKDHKDLLVLVDRILVIYDLSGHPIWYMPDIPELKRRDVNIRDFKTTADGTFTFMIQEDAVEVNYDGKIIWKAPNDGKVSGKNIEGYHHEFTKLSNGHYMVAGSEIIKREIPGNWEDYFMEGDKSVSKGANGKYYKEFTCSTLIEYDAEGKVLWSWKTSEHLGDDDFFWNKQNLLKPFDSNPYMNGFDFDEVNKEIFISYKNINRILRIAYPGGEVLSNYGDKGGSGDHFSSFYGQHSCRFNKRTNELVVFNNNHSDYVPVSSWQYDDGGYMTSHVVKYKIPPGKSNSLLKNWDYSVRLSEDKNAQQIVTRAGSIALLDDDCVLVNMGTLNLMLIIDKQKQKIWEAVPYTTEDGKRAPLLPYRCNYLNRKDIDKFLFTHFDTLVRK